MEIWLVLGSFFIFLLLKVPVAISMALSGFLAFQVLHLAPLIIGGQAAFNQLYSFTILAIPFYIFAGNIMTRGGISKALCDFAMSIFSRLTGGLGMVTVWASAFFAAISGSSNATVAAIGGMMAPEMEKNGYERSYGLAIAAASGVIGPIIPPSTAFVLYGVATNTSIGDLFIAGVVPGILLAGCLSFAVYITARIRGYVGVKSKISFWQGLWNAKAALGVPIIILGGIYSGIFTPTEAGAVACVYAIIMTVFIQRTLSFGELFEVLSDASVVAAVTQFLVAMAGILGKSMSLAQIPTHLSQMIMSAASNKFTVLLLINILLLICGCVMDTTASFIILAPLLLPAAVSFGVDPIQFAMIMCLNVGIGVITPPVGVCLFTASVIGNEKFEKIVHSVIPFLFAELAALLLINVFPILSTGLLHLVGK